MTGHRPRPASPEQLSRIERELTVELLDVLYQFADAACDELRRAVADVDRDPAASAVYTAVNDTADGNRPWDPAEVSLGHHLAAIVVEWVVFEIFRDKRRHEVRNGPQSDEEKRAWFQLEALMGDEVRFRDPLPPLDRELVTDFETLSPAIIDRPAVLQLRADCQSALVQIRSLLSADA